MMARLNGLSFYHLCPQILDEYLGGIYKLDETLFKGLESTKSAH